MITPTEAAQKLKELRTKDWYVIKTNRKPLSTYANVNWGLVELDGYIEFSLGLGEVGAIKSQDPIVIYSIIKEFSPQVILEIGRKSGLSTRFLAALAKSYGGKLYSIDGASGYGVQKKLELLNLADDVVVIEAWSPWVSFSSEIDFLFIDGDHSYISVIVDYHYFNYYLKKDGIVMFHDMDISGVREAVETIIKRDQLKELYKDNRVSVYQKTSEIGQTYFQLQDIQRKKEVQKKIK